MSLIMENIISEITTMSTPTGPYYFQRIFHNQIAKWLPYILDSCTNFMFEVLNRSGCWRRSYLLRDSKERSHKMLNHKISVVNCDHLFEGSETFPVNNQYFNWFFLFLKLNVV